MSRQWYEKQLRILQTVLREPDVVDYNAGEVVAYMEQIRANCLVINGGGVVDLFHHDLPAGNPNSFMTDQDILKDITRACHAKGIKVLVRVDFRGVEKHIYDQYPDWFAQNASGQPILRAEANSTRPIYASCYNGYYRNEHAFRFIELLFERYDIDGIWENAFQQEDACYCKTCQNRYRKDTGKDIPRGGDFLGKEYDEYRTWKEACANEHLRNCRAVVKKAGADKAYAAEIFGLYYDHYRRWSLDLYNIKDHFDFLVSPFFTANYQPLSGPSTLIKFMRSLAPDKTPVLLFGHQGSGGGGTLRYAASPAAETRAWLWETVSAGGSFWNCNFTGPHPADTYDRRNALLCQDAFVYLAQNEEKLTSQQSLAEVEVFFSRETRDFYSPKGGKDAQSSISNSEHSKDAHEYLAHLIGIQQVLLDQHIQYTIRPEYDLSDEGLHNSKLLVLPNAACLADEQIAAIRRFVRRGGKLLATHRTSLFDSDGKERGDFGLSDLFGCSFSGVEKDTSYFGYQHLAEPHPLTEDIKDTELVVNWGTQLLVRITSDSQAVAPLTYIPKISPQPPEFSWIKSLETDFPSVVVNRFGKGEVIYFPGEIDANVWKHAHPDFSLLLGNALNYLLGANRRVKTNAPVSLNLALNQNSGQPGSYLLHAVNYTSAPRRPIAQVLPIFDIEVELTLPGETLDQFEVLWGDPACRIVRQVTLPDKEVRLSLHLPRVDEYSGFWITTR